MVDRFFVINVFAELVYLVDVNVEWVNGVCFLSSSVWEHSKKGVMCDVMFSLLM